MLGVMLVEAVIAVTMTDALASIDADAAYLVMIIRLYPFAIRISDQPTR